MHTNCIRYEFYEGNIHLEAHVYYKCASRHMYIIKVVYILNDMQIIKDMNILKGIYILKDMYISMDIYIVNVMCTVKIMNIAYDIKISSRICEGHSTLLRSSFQLHHNS